MEDIKALVTWWRARVAEHHHGERHGERHDRRRRDEAGFIALEWLAIALGVIVIAGIAVLAVKTYTTGQTGKLGIP